MIQFSLSRLFALVLLYGLLLATLRFTPFLGYGCLVFAFFGTGVFLIVWDSKFLRQQPREFMFAFLFRLCFAIALTIATIAAICIGLRLSTKLDGDDRYFFSLDMEILFVAFCSLLAMLPIMVALFGGLSVARRNRNGRPS